MQNSYRQCHPGRHSHQHDHDDQREDYPVLFADCGAVDDDDADDDDADDDDDDDNYIGRLCSSGVPEGQICLTLITCALTLSILMAGW